MAPINRTAAESTQSQVMTAVRLQAHKRKICTVVGLLAIVMAGFGFASQRTSAPALKVLGVQSPSTPDGENAEAKRRRLTEKWSRSGYLEKLHRRVQQALARSEPDIASAAVPNRHKDWRMSGLLQEVQHQHNCGMKP